MRFVLKSLLLLVFLGALALAGYGWWYAVTPLEIARLPLDFEIAPGTRLRGAIEQLERAGVRVHRYQFELLARALQRERGIKAGSYELTQAPTPRQLLDKLTRGDVTQAEVRLIEGWTFAQFRMVLNE
ncbi:MAG TPA: endolytic transglycosylase MltG, partial [Burkholderiales bacterium]|nr:endolytic transglycosylase MltG [Burkholderiales bacterium]